MPQLRQLLQTHDGEALATQFCKICTRGHPLRRSLHELACQRMELWSQIPVNIEHADEFTRESFDVSKIKPVTVDVQSYSIAKIA